MAHPDKNPFELEGREGGGPGRPVMGRMWTAEEVAEKLGGYLEVPPEYWEQIRFGTHVRYFSKTEGYRPGGFVSRNPFDVKPKGGTVEKRYMRLQNGFNPKDKGYVSWIVDYESLAKVYLKPDAGVMVMMKSLEIAVQGLNANVRKVAEYAKKLEQRVAALERR